MYVNDAVLCFGNMNIYWLKYVSLYNNIFYLSIYENVFVKRKLNMFKKKINLTNIEKLYS